MSVVPATRSVAGPVIEIRVLGPFALYLDRVEVKVQRAQVRQVLTLLAVSGEVLVSADHLIEHLWPGTLPTDPRASLRVVLSRTRTALGPHSESLEAAPTGYRLECMTDLRSFQDQVQAATVASDLFERLDLRSKAIAQWSGPSPAALRDAELLVPVAAAAAELRWETLVSYAEDLCQASRFDEAVAIARPLALSTPERERVAIIAAKALAMTGRKAEGIRLLDNLRTHLREQMGIDPSDAALHAEREILHGSVELQPRAHLAQVTERLPFVGREIELETLCTPGGSGLHVVLGAPGTGKTRLIEEAASRLEREPLTVLTAASTPTPQGPMEALAAILLQLRECDPSAASDVMLTNALIRLAPDAVEPGARGAPPQTREALLDQVTLVLSDHAQSDRYAIVLDDCQWLDRSSAEVLDHVIQGDRCRLILASRQNHPDHLQFLTKATSRFVLEGLDASEVEQLRAAAGGSGDMGDLHARTGGNPLFLNLLIGAEVEGIETTENIPTNVLMAVQQRVAALPADVQDTLQTASAFLADIDLDLLEQLCPAAGQHTAQMVGAGLIATADDGKTLRFVHTLVAEALYQMLSPGQRLDLHDLLGRILEKSGASAASWALHAGESASFDPHRAVSAHIAAAEEFAAGFAWDTMLLHVAQAEGIYHDNQLSDERLEAEIAVSKGTGARALVLEESDDLLLVGTRMAYANGWEDLCFQGMVELCSHGRIAEHDLVGEEIREIAEWLLALDLTDWERAKLSASVSTLLNGSAHWERGIELYRVAFDIARRTDDPALDAWVLTRLDLGLCHPDDWDKRHEGAQRLSKIAGTDPDLRWEAAFLEFQFAQVTQTDSLDAHLEKMRELTPQVRLRRRDFGMAFCEASYAKYHGDLDLAQDLTDKAIDVGLERYSESWVANVCGVIQMSILEARGLFDLVLPTVEQHLTAEHPKPYWHGIAAAAAADAGDLARARAELDHLTVTNFESLIPDLGYSAQLAITARAVCALEDSDAARILIDLLAPFAGRMVWNGVSVHRPVDEVIAELVSLTS